MPENTCVAVVVAVLTVEVIAMDPITRNVYYVEQSSQDIILLSYPALRRKTLVRGGVHSDSANPIKRLVVDVRHR